MSLGPKLPVLPSHRHFTKQRELELPPRVADLLERRVFPGKFAQ
ncbi:MAG TPA: hypothetical protein VMF61_09565 [Candidatus Acidoferrales bacterium]|nr:hypothetical protein [Candidatus Acidoferrales bacterium]